MDDGQVKLNEIIQKYGGEEIYRPAIDRDDRFDYRGYQVVITKDKHDGYQIVYDPILPEKLAHYKKAPTMAACKKLAMKTIEAAHAMEVDASGHAAQAGAIGLPPMSGPLRRNNG